MKTIILLLAGLCAVSMPNAKAQLPATAPAPSPQAVINAEAVSMRVAERGPNHKKMVWETTATAPNGKTMKQQHVYTELATGLHYQKEGKWLETKEEFELVPGWAMARKGPHKLSLYYNLNRIGAVAVELPDGRVVRSQVSGLAYLDSGSGQSIMLGLIKDCAAKVLPPNQVIYEDAFTDIKADVLYTYTKAGIAQDVVLRRQLPDPAANGLNPKTTMLTVMTEFVDGPVPEVLSEAASLIGETDVAGGISFQTAPDISLQFGSMKMGRGRAFSLNDTNVTGLRKQVPVIKKWRELQGRKYLWDPLESTCRHASLSIL